MTEIRSAYSPKVAVQLDTGCESMTQQNFKKECDINHILKKYQRTGLIDHVSQYQGRYEDLSQPVDYQSALNVVIQAQAAFDSLPSQIRKQFENSPRKFLEFVNDANNLEEMYQMGLANRPVEVSKEVSSTVQPDAPAQPVKTDPQVTPS